MDASTCHIRVFSLAFGWLHHTLWGPDLWLRNSVGGVDVEYEQFVVVGVEEGRLKRIINVYNVSRRIVELRHGNDWSELNELKPKLLKFAILLEQWPYRATRRSEVAADATWHARRGRDRQL